MKKVLTLVAVAGMFSFIACGPSAEEIAAKEKAKQDSIAAVEAQKAAEEAAKAAEEAAKAAEEAKQKAIQDSIAKAAEEAAAKASKGKPAPKTQEQKVKEEAKKVTGGRG